MSKTLVEGWRPVVIPEEIYSACNAYYEEHKKELRLREGIRSLTAFINYSLREQLKKIGAV